MKQHTLQELADFTGCYITRLGKCIVLHNEKPVQSETGAWQSNYKQEKVLTSDLCESLSDLSSFSADTLIEPKGGLK